MARQPCCMFLVYEAVGLVPFRLSSLRPSRSDVEAMASMFCHLFGVSRFRLVGITSQTHNVRFLDCRT